MDAVKVGLIGLGTVGTGTVNVLIRNVEEIARRAGREIIPVIGAVQNVTKKRDLLTDDFIITGNPLDVVNHPDIDIVVELMGGDELAFDYVATAIKNKKHVVTANKALIAARGNELFKLAAEHKVMIAYEAAVAGGIPVIKAIREGLTANVIRSIAGIVNGTSNYILSGMLENQSDFGEMLAEATEKGYAEADPTFDIEGIDSAHKLTILGATAFGIPLQFDKLYIEGISDISYQDIKNAQDLGYVIKSLGIAKLHNTNGKKTVEMRVHPTLIPADMLLANVNGVMNAIMIHGDAVGESMFYGPGAGSEPTASSVVADIVDIARTLTADPDHRVPHLAFKDDCLSDAEVLPIADVQSAYYLNLTVKNTPGVLAEIATNLASEGISIKAIQQKEVLANKDTANVIILTEVALESNVQRSINQLAAAQFTIAIKRIRVGI